MAAGRASVSASREQVASRRPTRAPFFNEKEYFYRQRVLRRARKMTASFDRSGIPAGMVSLDTAAALAVRCSQLEWSAAVAHYNASFLHERLCRVEAAASVPPLPFPAASPEVQPEESTAGFRHDSAHAAAASGEADAVDAAAEGRSEQPVVWPAEPAAVQPAAPYVAQSAGMDSGASEPEEPTTTSKDAIDAAAEGRSKQPVVWQAEPAAVQPAAPYVARSAGMDSGASEPEEPTTTSKDAGSMAAVVLPQLEDPAEPPLGRPTSQWAVVQGLQKAPHYNGKLVRVGSQRPNGRVATMRPGERKEIAVWPANLRGLLEVYDGCAAGERKEFDDDEIELLGFDPKEAFWACKKAGMYLWIPAKYIS